jgi:four helix bundle protein
MVLDTRCQKLRVLGATSKKLLTTMDLQVVEERKENLVLDKSFAFAVRIVKFSKFLAKKKEHVIARQVLRSGIAIGALVREAQFGESKADFIHKMYIALKESNETCYWLELLYHTQIIEKRMFDSIFKDSKELLGLLISITKTAKANRR